MHIRQGLSITYHDISTYCTKVKSLFAIRDDYLGTGSQATAVGEQNCVLTGCEFPHVLRAISDNRLRDTVSAHMRLSLIINLALGKRRYRLHSQGVRCVHTST